MRDHKKEEFTLDVVSAIDDDVIEKNLKKRFELWFKRGKRKTMRWASMVAVAACLCILISAVFIFLPGPGVPGPGPDIPGPGPDEEKQVPVYRGMTVSNDLPVIEQTQIPVPYPTVSLLSATTSVLPSYDVFLLDQDDAPGQNKPNEDQGKYDESPDIVFGQTYYAMKNEDIYIYIHLSNPDEFEILSFTLNGKKYSSNMFEYGSDLQTLILKYNVGDVDGLQEYTIDAIKYVDGEKIKDVRMEGDRTVKVFVNDEKDLLQFNAELSFMTLTIAPTKPLISLALYEGEELLRTLSPTDTEITDLPFDKRLILKATYSDGTRTREAQHIFDTQKLSQGLIIDAGGVIRGMGSCTDTTLYINNPIGDEAFTGNKSLCAVYMGPSVTSIGKKAFYECTQLTTVQLSDSVTEIGAEAFSYSSITAVEIPSSLTYISSYLFAQCSDLTHITIPNSITKIEGSAFLNCTSLVDVTLPDSVVEIQQRAFAGCDSLVSIDIPYGVTELDGTFSGCDNLTSVTIPDSVTRLEGTFRNCTSLTSITIPGSVIRIGEECFCYCGNLQNVIISDSVAEIFPRAFVGCVGLTSITIPKSVIKTGPGVFNDCINLTVLYYTGTIEEWNAIDIHCMRDDIRDGRTNVSVIHCSDGDIIIE